MFRDTQTPQDRHCYVSDFCDTSRLTRCQAQPPRASQTCSLSAVIGVFFSPLCCNTALTPEGGMRAEVSAVFKDTCAEELLAVINLNGASVLNKKDR